MRVIHYTSANGSILLTIIIRIIYDMNIMLVKWISDIRDDRVMTSDKI